ncbi:uncharacterized protein LOC131060794 isoform X1 [Cryptomeria japonica]|uniref:uncharacterized protein LOC131060794 isoform X1 n=1 Tax=Cryptomeria japonica TaxID=3369 RepID=UPI0027DA25B8|nr:uncharacterized protein LOC131060794 isoform X1 [Cryptomeria japonica]
MGGRRRNKGVEGGRRCTPSYLPNKEVVDFSRPQKTTAVWIPAVPLLEKEFCEQSIGLSWKEFCEAKKNTIYFPDIEKWNDLAAAEAFHLAKKRYIAKTNSTPFDMPELDPSAYIDVVDWNSLDSGDIDWPEGHGSDSDNEENCANGVQETGNLPDLDQEITASEKERYEKEKSQWKERPFGYGRVYFPEIHEARTVICKVVDLYTAEPQLTDHWLVDLWSKSFRPSEKNSVTGSLVCNNNENIIGISAMQSGWTEDEKEVKTNSTGDNIEQKNGTMENMACQFAEGSDKKKWGNTTKTGLNENKMKVICYPKVHPVEQKNAAMTHLAKNEFEASGWGAEFEHDEEVICHPDVPPLICSKNQNKKWENTIKTGLNEIGVKRYPEVHIMEQKNEMVTTKNEFDASGWGPEFEHEKENEWMGNLQENFPYHEYKVGASKVFIPAASRNSVGCRYQDENECNYELGDCQHQNQYFAQNHWEPFSQFSPRRVDVPARRNRRFQTNKKVNGGHLSLNLNQNVELNSASSCNRGYFKECYPAPSGHDFQKNAKYWRQNKVW